MVTHSKGPLMSLRSTCVAVAFFSFALTAGAQSFNIDIGPPTSPFGVPSASYAAAANQPGVWNAVDANNPAAPLVDLSGSPTSVVLTSAGHGNVIENNLSTSGDDEALLDDSADLGSQGLNFQLWSFVGLSSGHYALYTYAWPGDDLQSSIVSGVTGVCGNTPDPAQIVGGPWPGHHVQGQTYALHHLDVPSGGSFCFRLGASSGFGQLNGFQLVREGPSLLAVFCSGDGTATACPCGNTGAEGRGCANSVHPEGASLWVTGHPSVSNDSAYFDAQWMPITSALLYQGTTQVASGMGAAFGDGLRCVGGAVRRISAHAVDGVNSPGSARWPDNGDYPVSYLGGATAGSTLHYQVWYRNAAAFCTSATFNLSNGVTVTWGP